MHKVLVVNTHSKLARMVMASAFRRIRPDWTLVEATSAAEALQSISAGAVEIALVDFNMPDVDGLVTGRPDPLFFPEDAGRSPPGQYPGRNNRPGAGT